MIAFNGSSLLGISLKYIENFYQTWLPARTCKWTVTNRQESVWRIETRSVSKNYFAEAEVTLNLFPNKSEWYSKRKKIFNYHNQISKSSPWIFWAFKAYFFRKFACDKTKQLTVYLWKMILYQQLSITTKMASNAFFKHIKSIWTNTWWWVNWNQLYVFAETDLNWS